MMNIQSDKDMSTWSVAHIKRLQQLQKRIITQSWKLLRPGGTLVYSTCTMAPEENEAVVSYLLRNSRDARLQNIDLGLPNRVQAVTAWNDRPCAQDITKVMRLTPSQAVEAFFVARLQKTAIDISDRP